MPSLLKTRCPHCQSAAKVSDEHLGKRVRCPSCKQPFEVSSVDFGRSASATFDAAPVATESLVHGASDNPLCTSAESSRRLGSLGRFELKELLGQGAFGRVYKAYDPQLDRFVALKVPMFGPDDTHKVQRFIAEAKAAARLRHPNIVPTYESGQIDGRYYIVAQFVAGQPLSKRIQENPPDFRQAADWVRQLADALAYAHSEGIVHRDIKPDNIMLDGKGAPQIMDFGLAKRINEDSAMTTDGSILGTPAYMAPEQARGDLAKVGPASDQYSLGVVLYELLTGEKPFSGPPHSVIAQVIAVEPPGPQSVNPKIPRDLEAICQKAMSKEVGGRYLSLVALSEDLSRWLRGDSTLARPIHWRERLYRWTRREPRVAALGFTAAGLLLLGAVLATVLALSEQRNARRLRTLLIDLTNQTKRASEAEQLAERRAQDAIDAANDLQRKQEELVESRNRALEAEKEKTERLWQSLLDRAKAGRLSGLVGQRSESLLAIAEAAKIRPDVQLRNEAIACMALTDLGPSRDTLPFSPAPATLSAGQRALAAHDQVHGYVAEARGNKITVRSQNDGLSVELEHPRSVESILWHPDGTLLAAACHDLAVYLWRIPSGRLQATLEGLGTRLHRMSFRPDGNVLSTHAYDGSVSFWDPISGRLLVRSLEGTGLGSFSKDGRAITDRGRMLEFIDARECRVLHHGEPGNRGRSTQTEGGPWDVCFSPTGALVMACGADGDRIWNVETGRELLMAPNDSQGANRFLTEQSILLSSLDKLTRHPLSVEDDGPMIRLGQSTEVWRNSTMPKAAPRRLSLSADGRRLVFSLPTQNRGILIDLEKSATYSLNGQPSCMFVAMSPDGRWAATSSWRWTPPAPLQIWNAQDGTLAHTIEDDPYATIVFSPDSRWLALGSQTQYRVFETESWKPQYGIKRQVRSLTPGQCAFSTEGNVAAIVPVNFVVDLVNFKTGETIAKLTPPIPKPISALCFSPDGTRLAVATEGNTVFLWNLAEIRTKLREHRLDWH